jgi:uncharacterized repeat protein (TIGR01451 family)
MKRNYSNSYLTANAFSRRMRSLILVIPALLVAYGVAGTSPAAFAAGHGGGSNGTVDVTPDSLASSPGNLVTFTVTVHNGSQAGWVTVTDNLPAHSTLVEAPGCTPGNGSVSCAFPMFPFDEASASVTILVDSNANCHANLRNTARVHGWPSASADVEVICAAP